METMSSRGIADLQAAMAMARQKNPALARAGEFKTSATKKSESAQNLTKITATAHATSVQSSKLVDKFYGITEKKQELAPIRVGSRFDAYA